MSGADTIAFDAAARLDDAAERPPLRFLTCGSVDDGKSTLLGRLLCEQNLILEDQLAALECDSGKYGTSRPEIDFSLLLDGLEAEREQRITIDVAYRYFATRRRAFVVADTPGHEQYTRNMATGASAAELAVLLLDARKGLLAQTRRHAIIVSLLGIRHIVVAVNKIDLVDFDRAVFDRIADGFSDFAAPLGFKDIKAIPISARYGDNVCSRSSRTPWYSGCHLLEHLETVDAGDDRAGRPFRVPVQWVNRPHLDFRGFSGTIVCGSARPGDEIAALPSGRSTTISTIIGPSGEVERAEAGDSVTVTLTDEIDISRGDMLVAVRDRPQVADQFAAHLVWMSNDKLLPGRSYLMKINHATVAATRYRSAPPGRHRHIVEACREDARAQRDRRLQHVHCEAAAIRSLRREPRDRRFHFDRSLLQRDGRRRHDQFCAAPSHQCAPSASGREQGQAIAAHAPPPGGPLVHRPAGRREIDDRQLGRGGPQRARHSHRYARR
jgi:bifunctional enzyme CysN/CysC